jgi:23S rRNA-/tRNA-specific pseudouridylate synthase
LFQTNQVNKHYLARVHGWPADDSFSETAAIGPGPSADGLRRLDPAGLPAETHFVVRQRFADGTALVEAQPITGRTNQIRLHLWHAGHPIVGDAAYLLDRRLGHNASQSTAESPLCLHAWRLSFPQPFPLAHAEDALCQWEAGWPIWADANWAPTETSSDIQEVRSAS